MSLPIDQRLYDAFWRWLDTQPHYQCETLPRLFHARLSFRIGGHYMPVHELCSLAELQGAYKNAGAIGMWIVAHARAVRRVWTGR